MATLADLTKLAKPLFFESTALLGSINGDRAFAGRLLGLDTIAQQLEREGGYLAVVGKAGPTFLFDNRVESIKEGVDSGGNRLRAIEERVGDQPGQHCRHQHI